MTPSIKNIKPINFIAKIQIRGNTQVKDVIHCKKLILKQVGEVHFSKKWSFQELDAW